MHFHVFLATRCTLLRRTVQRVGNDLLLIVSSRRNITEWQGVHVSGYMYRIVDKSSGDSFWLLCRVCGRRTAFKSIDSLK
jgi:hypothetical protein